jgi:aldose 1-epimerase
MSARYTIEALATIADQGPLRLIDRQTGAAATITPRQGANVEDLRLPVRGAVVDLFAAPEPPTTPPRRTGAPVLFPFPNRLRDARFIWQGQVVELPPTRGRHAIHGLVIDRPFQCIAQEMSDQSASVTLAIQSDDDPALAAAYPFAWRLELTYRLAGSFRTQATVTNLGREPMPFGLGFHPFFRVPLAPGGSRADCRVQLWAPRVWEVDGDTLPTGQQHAVLGALDLRGYPPLNELALDTFYTRLALDDPGAGAWSSRLLDPAAAVEVVLTADSAFREAVVFAPANRPVVSIEPYTCAADALNLAARGVDAGLLVLEPGERWTAGYSIAARSVIFADS